MFVTKRKFCDFALFTLIDQFIERVYYDQNFFENNCLPKLTRFYFLAYLPEIVLRNRSKKKPIIDLTKRDDEEIIQNY